MGCTKNPTKKRTKFPTPAESSSDSSEHDCGTDADDTSAANTVWIKSTITQLSFLKDFLSKIASTVNVLLSMLQGVSDRHNSSTSN